MPDPSQNPEPTSSASAGSPVRRSRDPPEGVHPVDLDERWIVPSGTVGKPCSIFVYGDCRPVVNGVAFALADMLDLAPLWLEVHEGLDGHDGPSVASAGWVPAERVLWSAAGSGLEPNDAIANLALWAVVRSDEPVGEVTDLTDFLRLPELIQEAIGRAVIDSRPRTLVVANTERADQLVPHERSSLQRFLRSITNRSVSLVVAHTGTPLEQRFAFSAAFRVHAPSFASWRVGSLECEKGLMRGPFAVGRPWRLSDVPSIARVLAGLQRTEG